jgi:hypothetical protein
MKQPSSSAGVVGGAKCLPCAPAAKGSMDGRLSAAAALGGNVVHGVAALSSELDEYVDENCRSGHGIARLSASLCVRIRMSTAEPPGRHRSVAHGPQRCVFALCGARRLVPQDDEPAGRVQCTGRGG